MDLEKLSDLVMQVLVIVLPYFAVLAARWIDAKYKIARAELSEQQDYALGLIISSAVYAAEQVYQNGKGAEKKAYALGVVNDYIAKTGLVIDTELIVAKIEAAVFAQV